MSDINDSISELYYSYRNDLSSSVVNWIKQKIQNDYICFTKIRPSFICTLNFRDFNFNSYYPIVYVEDTHVMIKLNNAYFAIPIREIHSLIYGGV